MAVGLKYIGTKKEWTDNHVAFSGLTWTPGQIHVVPAAIAVKFKKHRDIMEVIESIDDANLVNVGLVFDTERKAEVDEDATLEGLNKVEADKKQDELRIEEDILSFPELPASFEAMTNEQIAALAQRNYGVRLNAKMEKAVLVEAVRGLHNSRKAAA